MLRTASSARGMSDTCAAASDGLRQIRTAPRISNSSSMDITTGSIALRASPVRADTSAISASGNMAAG